MSQFPQPNLVIVMDNASIHKSAELRQWLKKGVSILIIIIHLTNTNIDQGNATPTPTTLLAGLQPY